MQTKETRISTKSSKNNIISVQKQNLVHSPYNNTTLVCPIMLYPNQMDNNMNSHLKNNLISKLVGKCYQNYGCIMQIYKINDVSESIIEAEDPTCSAKVIVSFTCRLCIPIKNRDLICKISRMNKEMISAVNGPICVIIVVATTDKINTDKFFTDVMRNVRIKENSEVVVPNMYIRIKVLGHENRMNEEKILVMGFLEDIASEDEIILFKKDTEETQNNIDLDS